VVLHDLDRRISMRKILVNIKKNIKLRSDYKKVSDIVLMTLLNNVKRSTP
jgi:hypothetical protein